MLAPRMAARILWRTHAARVPASSLRSSFHATTNVRFAADPPARKPRQDQTWKPRDEIKIDATGSSNVNTPPDGRPGPRLDGHGHGHGHNPADPVPHTADNPHTNEELRGPHDPEANTEPLQPLPDLRHGIPSTFGSDAESSYTSDGSRKGHGLDTYQDDTSRLPARDEPSYKASDYETSTDRRRAKLANYMYASIAVLGLTSSLYFGRTYGADEAVPSGIDPRSLLGWSPSAIWGRVKSRALGSVSQFTEPISAKLLPPMIEEPGVPPLKYTLVLSLEDLLVHSGWTREHGWRTAKRPGFDYFVRYLSQYYELVLFTTVNANMAGFVIEKLDPFDIIFWKLFNESTKFENGKHIKDLSYLNRPLDKVIIIDTKEEHVANQPENAIILPKWKGDAKDPHVGDLAALVPFLEYAATSGTSDLRNILASFKGKSVPEEFAKREIALRQRAKTDTAASRAVAQIDARRALAHARFEELEKNIREHGDKMLKQKEDDLKQQAIDGTKDIKSKWFGWGLGSGGAGKAAPSEGAATSVK